MALKTCSKCGARADVPRSDDLRHRRCPGSEGRAPLGKRAPRLARKERGLWR